MKGWRMAMAVALVLTAPAAFADRAKAREGGSSGDRSSGSSGSSSVGERHHSSDSGSARSTGSAVGERHRPSDSGVASSSSSRTSKAAPPRPLTDAERRHPRAGSGTAGRGSYYPSYYYRYGYNPYYYRPYYGYWGYWGYSPSYWDLYWDGGWGYGYATGPHHYYGTRYRSRYYNDIGSIRLMVEPEETKVYVDGYYAGEADDFDGIFQRLHVSPGRHDISLKLQGHQSHRLKVYVPPDETLKIHYQMVRGPESQTTEATVGRPWDEERYERRERYSVRRDRDDDEDEDEEDEADEDETGILRIDLEPKDATVYVDGEFHGSGRDARRLELAPGRHKIEIVRPGYKTVERQVDVRPGRSEDLEVHLEK